MNWVYVLLALTTFGDHSTAFASTTEQFNEELIIKPLSDGKVASTFIFTTILGGAAPRNPEGSQIDDEAQHYTLFPLTLGQILREYAVTELHLTLNSGNWDYKKWGQPTELGVGTGAELWAWMHGSSSSIDHRWKGLRNALAGLFCASLGALDDERTTSPAILFAPEGSLPVWNRNSTYKHQIRHASLASENVCTENLTPFFKLLPCKSLSGLASLFNSYKLFDADWHGMGVNVLWDADVGVTVRLTFQMVSDPLRYSTSQKRDWSLQSLFDRNIAGTCPVAHSSQISVALPQSDPYSLFPEPTTVNSNLSVAHYDLLTGGLENMNIAMQWPSETSFDHSSSTELFSSLNVQRTLLGSSQAHGTLSVVITNVQSTPIRVLYLETMPWLLQFYMHTLTVEVNGVDRRDLVAEIAYIPSVAHARPTTLECIMDLPANVSLRLTIEVTKSFLRYTDHPPDAQRGWDIPPAVILPISLPHDNRRDKIGRIYTPALLVDLATPDFSMPYNVIIFSCSVVAFIFGSIFNLLTRKFVVVSLLADQSEQKQ